MAERDELILANLIANRVERCPELEVLTFVSLAADGSLEEERRSYRQLWDNAQRIAYHLREQGLAAGDRFGLLMQNHPDFVEAMIAASITNTVFVPIDPRTRGAKLTYMLDFAECKGVILADYALDNLAAVEASLPGLEWAWVMDSGVPAENNRSRLVGIDSASLDDILKTEISSFEALEVAACNADDPMQMLYTSGTTGDPKAIIAPHRRFGEAACLGPLLGLTPEDRPYTGLSLTHANAQLVTLGSSLKMGLRGVISRKFTKSRLWDIARHYGCTVFNLLGGMTTAIFSEPRRDNDADNPVRYVISAGMPAVIWNEFRERFGVEIFEFYGAAEGGLTLNPCGQGPVGSVGKAPPTLELQLFNERGEPCAPFESGEICFRGADGSAPRVSYYKNAAASADKTEGGWLRMGDIGHLDEQGWLYFEYRKGGGIRRNGDFVNSAFVEKALASHHSVDDVYVYGVSLEGCAPGEKEVVAAIVVSEAVDFDPKSLFAHCRRELEASFVPAYLQRVEEIPKTASEKPQERFLLEQFHAPGAQLFTQAE
ncbi:class I adenylate-forming enzyme family protein [Aestuariirhabdus litorea]|uniref:ATP-dependent acyl-CoA ligase n=1 Tax=Aestuariirhabdus litorea TaxID=2528527 RepID=A0A3P3VKF3_9GAMM|nr:AMP-binding protein [Aestuariirhabdus litorea]RRJ83212.1 ATP-dependent acyl-CoA ligase [Aestuariirhabdus litorea]RWW93369.1 ATP-dependent acyl-CoA ligase [Endozoicomonadaceae bacterium GTF-13]